MDRCTTKRGRDPSRINNSSSSSSSSSSSYKLLSIPNFLSSARLPQSFTSLVCLIGTDGSRTVSTSFGKATTTESLNSPEEERWSSRRLEMKISVSCIHPLIFGRHFMSSFFLYVSIQGNINVSHPTSGERPHRTRFLSENRISILLKTSHRRPSRLKRARLSVCVVSRPTAGPNRPSTGWCRTRTEPCAASTLLGWRSIPKAPSGSPTSHAKTPATTLSTLVPPPLSSGTHLIFFYFTYFFFAQNRTPLKGGYS